MKPNASRAGKQRISAFTLVEILVSLMVLVLLVLLVANIFNASTRGMKGGDQRIGADSEARSVFNRLALDLSRMLLRPDLDYSRFKSPDNLQTGATAGPNDEMAFYAEVPGYFTANPTHPSPYSVVGYRLANGGNAFLGTVLQRACMGRLWNQAIVSGTTAGTLPPLGTNGGPTDQYQTVGAQVFRMEYTYLLKSNGALSITPWASGHASIDGFRDVSAIVVGIAVLDSDSRELYRAASGGTTASNLTDSTLVGEFEDAEDGKDILSKWMPKVASGELASSVPPAVAKGVRIYQRYFYLNNQ